jgi:hypothetical protein
VADGKKRAAKKSSASSAIPCKRMVAQNPPEKISRSRISQRSAIPGGNNGRNRDLEKLFFQTAGCDMARTMSF